MIDYFKRSYHKLKSDFLSKALYDILKWLFLLILTALLSKLLSKGTFIEQLFLERVSFSVFTLVLITLLSISVCTVIFLFLYRRNKALLRDILTDKLTGLPNDGALRKFLTESIKSAGNQSPPISIILIDIDNLKDLNSRLGHKNADCIIADFGKILGNDKRLTDETFRLYPTGDEFIIVAKETSISNAMIAAERKRKFISEMNFQVNNSTEQITVSCGIVEYKFGIDDYNSVINRASQALAKAKSIPGKNNSQMFA